MHDKFEEWAIIELFGHQRIAGRVSEQQIGGESFIRVDVPPANCNGTQFEPMTKLYGPGAIYCITPVTEQAARLAAAAAVERPVKRWELPARERQALAALDDQELAEDSDNG